MGCALVQSQGGGPVGNAPLCDGSGLEVAEVPALLTQVQQVPEKYIFLTLNKGTAHGVELGDCVIDGNGNLVGRISKAGYDWSTVLTVIDTDTSLGARVYRTKDIGIAGGDFALMDDGKLKLDSLPASCQLLEGDLVVTSGLGGYLPPDLVIGSVSELRADDSDTSNYAILTPAADLNSLTEVCIIKSFEIIS